MLRKGMIFRGKGRIRELNILSIDNFITVSLIRDDLSYIRTITTSKIIKDAVRCYKLQLIKQDVEWD